MSDPVHNVIYLDGSQIAKAIHEYVRRNLMSKIVWKEEPDEHDYPAAFSYLSLIFSEMAAVDLVKALRRAPMTEFHAKDIFRASGLPELDSSNYHVKKNRRKIDEGEKLSPLLL